MADTSLIKELRELTGMSIKEIKKALDEADGVKDKALEKLKELGAKVAAKRSDRETGEGVVSCYVHSTKKVGALIDLRSETDFVARNEEFQNLAYELAMQVASMDPSDVDDLMSQPFVKDPSKTVDELVKEAIGKLGENIKVERFTRFSI